LCVLALQGQLGTSLSAMTSDEARDARLSTMDVAGMLGLDRRTVLRIPRPQLDYWLTPGGDRPQPRRHRRYRRQDVERYAQEVLGRDIN